MKNQTQNAFYFYSMDAAGLEPPAGGARPVGGRDPQADGRDRPGRPGKHSLCTVNNYLHLGYSFTIDLCQARLKTSTA